MKKISALDFRKKFGETLDLVQIQKQTLLVERQNIPVGVFYPYEDKKSEVEKETAAERAERIVNGFRDWQAKWGKTKTEDSVKLVRRMRDTRYGKTWLKKRTHY